MRVVRGSGDSPSADRAVTDDLLESVAETGDPALRVWQPPEQVAFGRRDTTRAGYERARAVLADHGVPAIERSTGGHAVYFTGTTLSVVLAEPVGDQRTGIESRYDETVEPLQSALAALGVDAHRGEPAGAFCPGTHSLSAEGKIVGLAQRVRQEVAVVAAIVVLSDHEAIASLLGPVYDALDVSFDPESVGSVVRAGGPADAETVRGAIEEQLTAGINHIETVCADTGSES